MERSRQRERGVLILGVLQARLSSSRLPGKVLAELEDVPMIVQQLRRLKRSRRMDALIVATSVASEDAAVADAAQSEGVEAYRGPLEDVLARVVGAAELHAPSHVVRLTADCPLADWQVVDRVVEECLGINADYASNTLKPSWPDGLDVEVVRFEALRQANREADSPVEREHVTPFVHRRPDRFRLHSVENEVDLSGLRWTVDEPADLEFVRKVYAALMPQSPAFLMEDILALLTDRPELAAINAGFERNEGLRRSIERWKESHLS